MARVTVEDCIDKAPNRFDLVLMAAHRARELAAGAVTVLETERDKNPVLALREIAEETQPAGALCERMIEAHQTQIEVDEPEEDNMEGLQGPAPRREDVMSENDIQEEMMLRALMEGSVQPD